MEHAQFDQFKTSLTKLGAKRLSSNDLHE